MRKPLLILALLPFALFSAEPESIALDAAPITTVNLHVGWADVQRAVTIPAGPARRVRLDKIESLLIPNTLRGSGSNFVAATASIVSASEYDIPEQIKITDDIAEQSQQVADLKAQLDLHERQATNLQQLINWKTSPNTQSNEESPRTLTTAEIDAITKLNAQLSENLKEALIQKKAIRAAEKAIQDAQKALKELVADAPGNYARVELDLAASTEETTVTLHYQVAKTTWYPIADAVLTKDGLQIQYKAIVWQDTGSDWSDVTLSLTHGSGEPRWLKSYNTKATAVEANTLDRSKRILTNARAAGVPSIWLTIPKATIPSNGILASVDGPTAKPEVTRRWVLNAQTGDRAAASLILKNTDPIGYPSVTLRPGPLTQTQLPAIPGGDSLTVSLQPDANLTVTRTPLPGSTVSASPSSGKRTKSAPRTLHLGGYQLTVHNAYDTPRTVELYEPLNGRTFLGATPHAASATTHLHWSLTIPPNASKSVTWTYRQ